MSSTALFPPRLTRLIDALRRLPGVGPKSAQRMAFHLLTRDPDAARQLGSALDGALDGIGRCPSCRMFCEDDACRYCTPGRAQTRQLCIVEGPADLVVIEQSTQYRGRYFVLMGHLSPLDGLGPEELGLDRLVALLDSGVFEEVIIALQPSMEREATVYYLSELARVRGLRATRMAQGIPQGGELEYLDAGTLNHALSGRTAI